MIEKQISNLPILQKELTVEGATKANDMPSTFNEEYQEEILSYLFWKPLSR